jgi:hypothetical protein
MREYDAARKEQRNAYNRQWCGCRKEYVNKRSRNYYRDYGERAKIWVRLSYYKYVEERRAQGREKMRTRRLTDEAIIEIAELNGLLEKGAPRQEQQIFLKAFKMVEKQTNEEFEKWMKLTTA